MATVNLGRVKGDKGDKGDRGEQGIQGVQGVQGIQGERGEKGDQGIQGIPGEKGLQGVPGVQGERGEKGEQGETGVQGAQGIQGVPGPQGPAGASVGTFEIALPAGGWSGTPLAQSVPYPQGVTLKDTGLLLFRDQDMPVVSKAQMYKSGQSETQITFACAKPPTADVVAVILKIG